MKRLSIIMTTVSVFLCMACENWLDVNASSELDRSELFKSENGYGEALIGVYAKLCDKSLYGRELTFDMADVLAGYYKLTLTTGNGYWYRYSYADPSNTNAVNWHENYTEDIWSNMYAQIANLNSLLETIDANKHVFSDDNYNLIKGEALGLRGFLHFELLRLFAAAYPLGKDKVSIPYVTHLTHSVTPLFTQEDAISAMLSDLTNAKTLMANDPIRLGTTPASCLASLPSGEFLADDKIPTWHNRRFRFNYYAAVATMARVFLWKGDRENALLCAQEVIRDQETKFPWVLKENLIHVGDVISANNFRNQDRAFATEHIFALNITDLKDCIDGYIQGGLEDFSTVDTRLGASSEDRSAVYEENTADVRYQYWFEPYMNYFLIAKFYQNAIVARYFQERLPLIRLSEMYYIAAECAVSTSDGVDYLEKVRMNRGLVSFPLNRSMSREELLQEIRKEYRKEFWGEGQLWFYYKRNSITDFSEYMTNTDFFTFKIPDVEESTAGREK